MGGRKKKEKWEGVGGGGGGEGEIPPLLNKIEGRLCTYFYLIQGVKEKFSKSRNFTHNFFSFSFPF